MKLNSLDFDLDKIKFATDSPTLKRAIKLYEDGKVTQVEERIRSYSARVLGTKPYRVSVEARSFDYGHCTCYLGQRDILCKHMVALALHVVKVGKVLSLKDKTIVDKPVCSGRLELLSKEDLVKSRKDITQAMRYIKPYIGPSRTWHANQNSLEEGCKRLSVLVTELPVNIKTAELLVGLLIRLDRKLTRGGVDDSNGIVGGFIEEVVEVLKEYVELDSECMKTFNKLRNRETCFGWEESLLELIDKA